jgi:hypothetical protein
LRPPPTFGAQVDYSNTNTVLLGMVIEEVTGKQVEDVFQEEQPAAVAERAAVHGEKAQAARLREIPGAAGYGIAMGCVDGGGGQTRELPGFNTSVFYDTTSDTTVIVQVNSDISSGDCPDDPTLIDDPGEAVCSSPASRMFVALADALGHPFEMPS